jgi:hypothetical protein
MRLAGHRAFALRDLSKNNAVYGDISWPALSHDLSACDLFLWLFEKKSVSDTFGILTLFQTKNF